MFDLSKLTDLGRGNLEQDKKSIRENTVLLDSTLEDFNVDAEVVKVVLSAITTQYYIKLGRGVKVNQVTSLRDNLALALSVDSVDIGAERGLLKISINNRGQGIASFKSAMENKVTNREKPLTVEVGTDTAGLPMSIDLAKAPHLLVAGATGSGKSVFLNSIINDLILNTSPEDVRVTLVDPKRVEFSQYRGIPHVRDVITDNKLAVDTLERMVDEMNKRYKSFETHRVKDIKGYNRLEGLDKIPYEVVIVDEMADLMMNHSEVEDSLVSIAQLGRASGIHIIIATQRPTVNVITGNLKANIPSRVAFRVASGVDSRTILDHSGAEKLKGNGDMLLKTELGESRVQGLYITDDDICSIVEHYRVGKNVVKGSDVNDTLIDLVVGKSYLTADELSEKYSVGYHQAMKIIDEMVARGYLGSNTLNGYKVLI